MDTMRAHCALRSLQSGKRRWRVKTVFSISIRGPVTSASSQSFATTHLIGPPWGVSFQQVEVGSRTPTMTDVQGRV